MKIRKNFELGGLKEEERAEHMQKNSPVKCEEKR